MDDTLNAQPHAYRHRAAAFHAEQLSHTGTQQHDYERLVSGASATTSLPPLNSPTGRSHASLPAPAHDTATLPDAALPGWLRPTATHAPTAQQMRAVTQGVKDAAAAARSSAAGKLARTGAQRPNSTAAIVAQRYWQQAGIAEPEGTEAAGQAAAEGSPRTQPSAEQQTLAAMASSASYDHTWRMKATTTQPVAAQGPLQVDSPMYRTWATFGMGTTTSGATSSSGAAGTGPVPVLMLSQLKQQTGISGRSASPVSNAANQPQPHRHLDEQQQQQQQQQQRQQEEQQEGEQLHEAEHRQRHGQSMQQQGQKSDAERLLADLHEDRTKPGMNPRYLQWFQERYPGSRPPRREDAEALFAWLHEQMADLRKRLHQQYVHQPGGNGVAKAASRKASSGGPAAAVAAASRSASPCGRESREDVMFEDGSGSLLLLRQDAQGYLDTALLQEQEELFSACMDELCRQVTVGCVERGSLMAQLWVALRHGLAAAVVDRDVAIQHAQVAREGEARAQAATAKALQRGEDQVAAQRAINEKQRHRLGATVAETEEWKQKHAQLADLLQRLSGAQQLVQQLLEAQERSQAAEARASALQQSLTATAADLDEHRHSLAAALSALSASREEAAGLKQVLGCSTPRPQRHLGLVADLLSEREASVLERALVGGVPARHLHQMLLGLGPNDVDLMPWAGMAGCSQAGAALQGTEAEREAARARLVGLLTRGDVPGLSKHIQNEQQLQLLGEAVHHHLDTDTLVGILDGTFGAPGGVDCMAAAPLLGVLRRKFGHGAEELGGAVTEALRHAQLSTKERMAELEAKNKEMHREIVLLKRTVVEQRKHEAERIDAALKDQQRKIARRGQRAPSTLDKFLQTQWGEYFEGIGTMEELPRVLRANVPINNKKMSKREAEKLVREVWAGKDEHEALTGAKVGLTDYLALFLEKRFFAIPRLVTEVAYNLIYSLNAHNYDADCNLFLRIFTGEVEETVRTEQQQLEAEILRAMQLVDLSVNHQVTGWLCKADVRAALAGFFKGKKIERLNELFEAIDTDEASDAVHYSVLFEDDSYMNQGMFAETIRGQHLNERLEYLQEIEDAIRDVAEESQSPSLTPNMLITSLKQAHKTIDETTIDTLVGRAFGPTWQQSDARLSLGLGAIIKRIRRGTLQLPAAPTAAAGAAKSTPPAGKMRTRLASTVKDGVLPAGSNGPPSARGQRRRSSGAGSSSTALPVGTSSSSTGPSAPASAAGQQRRRGGASVAAVAGARGSTPAGVAAAARASIDGSPGSTGEPKGMFGSAVTNALESVVAARAQHGQTSRPATADAVTGSRPGTAGSAGAQPLIEAALRTASGVAVDAIVGSIQVPVPVLNAMQSVRQRWMQEVASTASAAMSINVDGGDMQRQHSGGSEPRLTPKSILRPSSPGKGTLSKRTSFGGGLLHHDDQQQQQQQQDGGDSWGNGPAGGLARTASAHVRALDAAAGMDYREEVECAGPEDGKRNALVHKCLSKQKSLQRLEAAMLEVAIELMSPEEAAEVLDSAGSSPAAWSSDTANRAF